MMVRALVVLVILARAAHADTTLGLFAPSAPFPSTAARVELANRLGGELGKAGGGAGAGRVYARATDFAAAVKRGEVTVALVDPAYLAHAGGGFTVLAVALRGGEVARPWQLVARSGTKLAALAGKHVLVPSIGGREADLALAVLFAGEVDASFFGKLDAAPDSASALAAIGLGKADAAIVPAGGELPPGTAVVLALPAIANPVLVAYGSVGAKQAAALTAAAVAFKGDATVTGFREAEPDVVGALAARFTPPVKRGPFAVPAIRIVVGDLVEQRTFAIERTPAAAFAIAPPR